MGLAPNDGLIRPKYPRAANTPFKNDFYNKIGHNRTHAPQQINPLGANA
jgi:hypothetical protein